MERAELKSLMIEVLDERARIDPETHGRHHEYLDRWMQREAARAERIERIRASVYGWAIITFIGGGLATIGSVTWYAVQAYLESKGYKHGP